MLWKIFIAVLALSVAAQFFIDSHPHFAPERLPLLPRYAKFLPQAGEVALGTRSRGSERGVSGTF